ncbi:MAG: hypothetical protein Ctma_0996 [Catillopecten margaritatus gill symbiont]|uniref:Transposase n=1 Tax=Catillopecten margaritatus gill symbiont TaxID=3083288 RepID=A0AAU6PH48_9GAMM
MKRKNKYYNRSRLSEAKFREVIKYFSVDLSATQIAQLTNLNLNTVNKILTLVRIRIFELSDQYQLQSAPLVGQIEVDESFLVLGASVGNAAEVPGAR